ncbi:MAG: glycosyltransferase [Candidatus Eisenbacteria sp.]|nr:glycosyltransferase [Candidatus Eisenbacteria bacterium]
MAERFRIVHVNTARSWRGGERQVVLLARGLKDHGHTVLLVCQPGSPLAVRAAREELPVVMLRMRGEWDLPASMRLASCVTRFGADLVHLHTAHAHTLGLLAGLWTRMPPRIISRRVDFRPRSNPLSRLKYRMPGQTYIAVSRNIRDVLVASGVDRARIRTIYSGIPIQDACLPADKKTRGDLEIPPGTHVVVSVAALAPHKDHSTLLRAAGRVMREVPEAHFLLVGEGECAGRIRKEISDLGLQAHVTMAGFRDDVDAILAASDLFVSSSWLEGLGTSIIDAMAAGLPVVATRVGGIPEVVRDGQEGLLVPARDPEALARALVSVLGSESRRNALGQAAARRASRFSIDRTIAETEALYSEVKSVS